MSEQSDSRLVSGGGFAVRGMAKRGGHVKIPKSGGVEGFDDVFLKSIKKRINTRGHHDPNYCESMAAALNTAQP